MVKITKKEYRKGRICYVCPSRIKDKNISGYCKKHFGLLKRKRIAFNCNNCGKLCVRCIGEFSKRTKHFCSRKCLGKSQSREIDNLSRRFGTGKLTPDETLRRIGVRFKLNKAIGKGVVVRQSCSECGLEKSEAHHPDYNKPLDVIWVCRQHHALIHKVEHLSMGI